MGLSRLRNKRTRWDWWWERSCSYLLNTQNAPPVAREGRKKSVGSRCDRRLSASSRGLRPAIAFLPLDTGQIDAVEDHGQVGRGNLEAVAISTLGRKTEAAFFEPLEARITLPSC